MLRLQESLRKKKKYPEAILHYNRILQDHPDDQSTRAKRDALMAKQ